MKKHLKTLSQFIHAHKLLVTIAILSVLMLGAGSAFVLQRTQIPLDLSYIQSGQPVNGSFTLEFGKSVAKVGRASISPDIPGEWQYEKDAFGVTGVKFRPRDEFAAGQRYEIAIADVVFHITGAKHTANAAFTTEEAPGVLHFSVPIGNKSVVAADQTFSVTLTTVNGGSRDVVLESEPAVEYERTQTDQGYQWRAKGLLPQGSALKLIMKDAANSEQILTREVTVAAAPEVESVSKEADIIPGDTVEIIFHTPIDTHKSAESVQFDTAGKGEWASDTRYRFTPENIEPGQTYAYRLQKGLRTREGGLLAEDTQKTFSTRGEVRVAGVTPTGNELSQARQMIRITFNQPVDKKSAEAAFRVSAGRVTGFSWDGQTMIAVVENMGYQARVDVGLGAGVKPAGFGGQGQPWGYSFTTEVRTVKLAVPYYKQAYAQSCEAASVRMALAYRGIGTSDWDVLQKFGYHPRHKNQEANEWDDPQKQFVGDVNGQQGNGTGWGVYAEPVAAAVRQYGRQATTQYGVSAPFLAEQIHNDRPVVLWGIWGNSATLQTWTTPSGGTASGPFPMHVRLVVGVKGEPHNPLGFYVHDPITGSAYWSTAQLMANTQKAGPANQAVVIY